MPSESWKGLVFDDDLDKAYNTHKGSRIVANVDRSQQDYYEKNGFIEKSSTSKKVKMVREKKHFELFEDAVWTLLYKLGFTHMNQGSDFGIPISDDPEISPKQIDVFASDGKVALVIECKSADCDDDADSKSHDFKSELNEIRGNIDYQTQEIKKYFNAPNMDVGFVFFTRKYSLGEANKRIAKLAGISVLNEYDLQYYYALYKTLGESAKYQILCDIFKDKTINSIEFTVPAVKGTVSGHTIYSFLIEPSKLLPLSYVAHRKINDQDIDKSYQRMINKKKLSEIKNFIEEGGFFSNNIIVNIQSETEPQFDIAGDDSHPIQNGILHLPSHYKSIWVIDGQHRLYSFSGTNASEKTLIPVTAFYNLSTEMQSKIFVDINSKQKKVDPNLLIAIESDAKIQSNDVSEWTDALNTAIFREMSDNPNSVFYNKIKNQYKSNSTGDITIKTLHSAMKKTKLIGSKGASEFFIPGPLFSSKGNNPEETKKKAIKFLDKTFNLFRTYCPSKWDCPKDKGGYLSTSNGITALLYTIAESISIQHPNPEEASKQSAEKLYAEIEKYIKTLAIEFEKMSDEKIKLFKSRQGAFGQDISHKEMLLIIHQQHPKFNNKKIEAYIEESDSKYSKEVMESLPLFEEQIVSMIKNTLQEKIGEEWYKNKDLIEIGKKLNELRFNEGNPSDSIEDYIDIEIGYDLIERGTRSYFKLFECKSEKGKSYEDRTEWTKLFRTLHRKVLSNEVVLKNECIDYLRIKQCLEENFEKIEEND